MTKVPELVGTSDDKLVGVSLASELPSAMMTSAQIRTLPDDK